MYDLFNAGTLESLLKNIHDVITVVDDQGVILYQSQSVAIFGYEPGEMIGDNVLDFVHPDDHGRAIVSLGRTVSKEDDTRLFRCRFKHADGSWRWVEAIGDVIDDDPANGIIISTRDVTKTQEYLREIKRSQELLDAAFNATGTIFSVTRPVTGEFLQMNNAWEKVTGWTREEAIGRTANELNIWGTPENRQKMLDKLGEDGQVSGLRMNIQTKRGEQRTILMDAQILRVQEGERMLLSAIDVTEQDKLERQLQQAKKMEALGQLTGGMAHDFNNLLSVIIGHAEMIELKTDDSAIRDSLNAIMQAATGGADLVQSLLAFSRQQHLKPEPFSLCERIGNLRSLLAATLAKNIELDIDCRAAADLCSLDTAQFDSAILNLVLNAQHAMPQGGKLSISTVQRQVKGNEGSGLKPGEYLDVIIKDTGIGMSAAALEKAFDPFFTTRQVEGGSGLGLSMVFGFVTQSGGDVSIRSRLGEGTEVTLTVPRIESGDSG